jgi:Flp pilus assembly protein protease CpaA
MAVGLLWLVIAVIQDFRKREVANWWNFSLIAFVLSFRGFVSLDTWNYWPFMWGLVGLVVGFILSNLFYYSRLFAGGDAKLVLAICTVLPFSFDWKINLVILVGFVLFFILTGSVYGLIYSIFLSLKYRKRFVKEFFNQFKTNKKIICGVMILALVLFILSCIADIQVALVLSIVLFISPALLLYGKSIEESSMVKEVKVKDLTVGDWIIEKIKVGKKSILPNWEGLSENEVKLIQNKLNKNKQILVKEGIPFTPSFLFGFLLLLYLLRFLVA